MVSQILAVIIFVVMFVEIVREKFPRYLVTLVAGVLTLVVGGVGVDPTPAAAHACKIEHDLSDESFEKIKAHVRQHTQ